MASSSDEEVQKATFDKICAFLKEKNANFTEMHHPATSTSEQSMAAYGETDMSKGAKAMVLKTGDVYRLFVLSGNKRCDMKKIKEKLCPEVSIKKLRFATVDELKQLTGLVPNCVPPFGKPILPFDLYVDNSIAQNDRIFFNAGSLSDSIKMQVNDYLEATQPTVFDFSS